MALKVGDLVQLKSGGPKMTVNQVSGDTIWTSWFAGAKHERANFYKDALKEYVEEDKK
ncbi:uncharacterized small protein [Rhizobium leguminosarum bv. trifolii WSM597]|uniref:Uncharacterized small protein n=1 Tax=Rhizobium leguminosarum bv. trifolii WSM597 TaxID=754764 RepID=I9X2G4_RHILT|nr:DUF2158 domain-containing protein [Rhizobium leguminosarum]EJB02896.1 uncharacterized small protein [Rhizobium leguminosarum bv. trifolii WSM597]